ncbi:YihY/virulence factor BrkB family protein [Aquihabitans daechungensis]|uniref:YihY/virulence factor BrkB family protein n=1 Tax=Aquihabitans daechungensis TaxID=1052257 RepID=UPI003BA08059
MPAPAWRDIAKRVVKEVRADNVPLLSAGVAFFALLALFPALVAIVSLYGLVADPSEVGRQIRDLTAALPSEARTLITDQVRQVAAQAPSSLGTTAAVGIALALWSASSGMRWLLSALSLAYDEAEERKFLRLRGIALLMTVGATTAFVTNLVLLTATSGLSEWLGLGTTGELVINVVRWPVLAVLIGAGLAVLYRYGPDRDPAQWRWVTWGSAVATGVAVVASAGLAAYSSISGSMSKTYGSFAGIIVLMLWLMTTVFAILLGAEVNAEMEHQTARDTTTGHREPLGMRGATVADEVAPSPA